MALADPDRSSVSDLDKLVRPLSGTQFVQQHFRRSAVVFRPESPLQSAGVWQGDDWQKLSGLRSVDAAGRDEDDQHTQHRIDASTISAALEQGHTICGDITHHGPVRAWLDEASRLLGLGNGGFGKLYASPKGKGFPMHLDPHHVFVLQCRGKKRWRFGREPALPNARENAKVGLEGAVFSGRYEGIPLYGAGGPLAAPSDDDLDEVILEPGDALYLPPGTWHTACASEFSLAISLSPPRLTPYDLVLQWLDGQSLQHPDWFADLSASQTDVGARLMQTLAQVAAVMQEANPKTLVRQWGLQLSEGPQRLTATSPVSSLTRNDVLCRPRLLPFHETVRPDGPALVFYGAGQEWSLPLAARPFVETLAATPRFVAEDVLLWDENLRWPEALAILQELVDAGVLVHASG